MKVDPRLYDAGAKGYLTRHEFKCFIAHGIGFRPRKDEIDHLCKDGRVDYADAAAYVAQSSDDTLDGVKDVFDALDVQGRGFLTLADLMPAFATSMPALKAEVLDAAFDELDIARTGRLSYQQFLAISNSIDRYKQGSS